MLFKYFLLILLAGLSGLILPRNALSADSILNQANSAFQQGSYADALSLFETVTGPDRGAAAVGASRVRVMIGDYSGAEAVCRNALDAIPQDERIHVQLSKVLALTGRSDEAIRLLEPIVSRGDPTVRSLVQFAGLLRFRGRSAEAEPYLKQAIANYDQGLIFGAEDVALVAEASRALERFHDANNLFREAVRIDPENLETHVLWGNLFLEKYNAAEARRSYALVLKQNDKHVPALIGMAQAVDNRQANEFLDTALAINGRSVAALVARAGIFIADDRTREADNVLQQALQINPESAEALTLRAAIAYMAGDQETFAALEKSMASFSRVNGRFYARIAEICGRSYLFEQAVQMARKAVMVDPGHWNGHTVLSMNLLRLGREAEGRVYLEKGFEGDPFNVWAINMLRVLDVLDGFVTRRTEHFIVRMDPGDARILWPYLEPLLTEAWKTLTARYDFKPRGPVLIEIFTDHQDFAVRTSGLPEIGHLLGVCFGNLITLNSPRAHKPPGSINWQEVVWHEFAHVITLQMTENRIPRWLSEGVSVFEEKNGRPEWGRRQDLELVTAVQEGRIMALRQLDAGFSQAKTLADLNFAYYQSALLVEYIAERYGFEALKALINQYGSSGDMDLNFTTVLHTPLPEVEASFLAWLKQRVETINIQVPVKASSDTGLFAERAGAPVDALRERLQTHPRDFSAHFKLGLIHYRAKEFEAAVEHLAAARDLLPGYSASPSPRQILAEIYAQRGDTQAMIREQEALVKVQQHAFKTCLKLGQAAQSDKDIDRAVYYLERAIAVNPYDPEVHRSLGTVAMQTADFARAIREYRVLLALDNTDPALANADLAEAFLRDGNKTHARKYALAALEIAPMFERAQDILLDTLAP